MQSDCGVHGSLAQAGVPGLFPSNHPFQEMKQPTIHWASIWPPFPPSKSGLKHNTRQPAGSHSRNSARIPTFINPSMDDANSASTFPTLLPPSLGYPSSPFPGQSYFPALLPASSLGLGGIFHQLLPLYNLLPPQIHPVTSSLLWPLPPPFTFLLKSLRP